MSRSTTPPRPITPGDVVVAFSDALGEWTAAQITDLELSGGTGYAGVLELDWSGPEPASLSDLGDLVPLRLTHHAWQGELWHAQRDWLLPRGARVLGNAALVHSERTGRYAGDWNLGQRLALQRRWDDGDPSGLPTQRNVEGAELSRLLECSERYPAMRDVMITDIESVDAGDLVALFPRVTRLQLFGELGSLTNACRLNRLTGLRVLHLEDLFEMTAADRLLVAEIPHLESISLRNVPVDYARAMRREWAPEEENGTHLEITGARKPQWVQENRDNPLRDWDGREHISAARYRTSVALYRATRRAVLELLTADGENLAALTRLGRDYAIAFNEFDAERDSFIETREREELLAALHAIVSFCEKALGRTFDETAAALTRGTQSARAW